MADDGNVETPQEGCAEVPGENVTKPSKSGDDNPELTEVVVVTAADDRVRTIPTIYDTRNPQFRYAGPPRDPRRTDLPPSYEESTRGGYQRDPYIRDDREPEPQNQNRWWNRGDDQENQRGAYFNEDVLRVFEDKEVRNRFVQRVYSILTVQLLCSFLYILMAIYIPEIKIFMVRYFVIVYVAMAVLFVLLITLMCCSSVGRQYPCNFICLAVVTACMAYITAFLSIFLQTNIVLGAMGLTAIVCFLVSIFACFTKWDITSCGCCLCICSLVLMVFGMVLMILLFFMPISRTVFLVYSCLACLLFTMYLMYDTQLIVGGRRYELSTEDYIFGALCLYMDVMQIFQMILLCFGLNFQS